MKLPATVVQAKVSLDKNIELLDVVGSLTEASTNRTQCLMEASTNTTQSLVEGVSEVDLLASSSKTTHKVRKSNPKRVGKENIQPVTSVKTADIYFHKLAGHPSWPVRVTGMSKAG